MTRKNEKRWPWYLLVCLSSSQKKGETELEESLRPRLASPVSNDKAVKVSHVGKEREAGCLMGIRIWARRDVCFSSEYSTGAFQHYCH